MAHLNGIDTYFERKGDGPPLLFLNGSGATLASAGGIAPVANGELVASRIPGAALHIDEGGHRFVFQDPAAFPDIISFLTIPSA